MADALEKSMLDGSFFRGPRTPSPTRSASTASDDGEEDGDGGRSISDGGSDDGNDDFEDDRPKTFAPRAARSGQSTNTGPKGVRADRAAHDAQRRDAVHRRILETNARMQSMALVGGTSEEQDALRRKADALRDQRQQQQGDSDSDSDFDDDFDDEEDLAALRRYRATRMAEFQSAPASTPSLIEIHSDKQYLETIEDGPSTLTVIAHIYSKNVHTCRQLTASLASLARQQTAVKFIQVDASVIAFGGQDEDVLPTVLIYRGGELLANLVRIDLEPEWGAGQEKDVAHVLQHNGAW